MHSECAAFRLLTGSVFGLDCNAANEIGSCRDGLTYRLNVVTLRVPSLTQRQADVPLLFLQLVREASARYGREPMDVPPDVISDIAELPDLGPDWLPRHVRCPRVHSRSRVHACAGR